jgi:hypothetical protein
MGVCEERVSSGHELLRGLKTLTKCVLLLGGRVLCKAFCPVLAMMVVRSNLHLLLPTTIGRLNLGTDFFDFVTMV